MNILAEVLADLAVAALGYFVIVNGIYLVFTGIAWHGVSHHTRARSYAGTDEAFASPLTPGISVLVPAYNEEASIVESVRSLLALRYPEHEVVVISDGSTDSTLERLSEAFELVPIRKALRQTLNCAPIRASYVSRQHPELIVVDKENGGKADALNCGVNVARYPYVCAIDADAVLEEDALLKVAKPILDDPDLVAATGGVIRIANGCTVDHGRVTSVALPSSPLAVLQVVEYFRAFLVGRVGWSRVGSLLIISGAFGLFRRSLVEAVGGWWTETVGEDVELVFRLHRYLRERGEDYKIEFVVDPVCWTECPEDLRTLSRQRRRWQRGLAQSLWRHRAMIGNPRFGAVGLVAIPYFILFELLGPLLALAGLPATIAAVALGTLSYGFFAAFLIVSMLLGLLLTIAALALEEFGFRRHAKSRDMGRMLLGAIAENFGYRQLTQIWSVVGLIDALRRKKGWGAQRRRGLGLATDPSAP